MLNLNRISTNNQVDTGGLDSETFWYILGMQIVDVRNPGIEIGGPLAKSRLRVMGARHT
jgi:hypothetical protein